MDKCTHDAQRWVVFRGWSEVMSEHKWNCPAVTHSQVFEPSGIRTEQRVWDESRCDCHVRELKELREQNRRLREALNALVVSGVRDIDPRLDYIEVQIDRNDWQGAKIALAATAEGKAGE